MAQQETGRWHGSRYYIGFHYDLHAKEHDPEIGQRTSPKMLATQLEALGVDFVQTDTKGHPGYTSWFSKTPGASIAGGMKRDALKDWRTATAKLGMPLHCHYSGIYERAAALKHPDWAIVCKDTTVPMDPNGQNAGAPPEATICPRSGYLDELMIPQMIELIDNWGVNGFWVDGDIWAVVPCYCPRCLKEYTKRTGATDAPVAHDDPEWPQWMNFVRESFEEYVTKYCDAVHKHKPGVLVCSNWAETFRNPGEPKMPTDWISGDNTWVYGVDDSRCESRFISTRGKHWDIMLWTFYKMHSMGDESAPWVEKPAQMLQQEAAVIVAMGGSVMLYSHHGGVRDGRLIPSRVKQIRAVTDFIRKRESLCKETETIPQIAVLHSEFHARAHQGANLMWGTDLMPARGAALSFLENHYGVDMFDEWALGPRMKEFPVIVAPEQDDMSDEMVLRLKDYTKNGGTLFVSGAKAFEKFGGAFLGCTPGKVETDMQYSVPCGDQGVPVFSKTWRLCKPRKGAEAVAQLGTTLFTNDRLLQNPPAIINKAGKGKVVYFPFDIFRFFDRNHFIGLRQFIGEIAQRALGTMPYSADAPSCIDMVLRKKGNKEIIHFINRASGIANRPNDGAVDEIPPVGPVTLSIDAAKKPHNVSLAFEKQPMKWKFERKNKKLKRGKIVVTIDKVHIHSAVVVER